MPHSSSLPSSPGSSPVTLSQQLRRDFNIQELESPGSSPRQEILREEYPPRSPPSLSLNISSPDQRDDLPSSPLPLSLDSPSPPTLNLTPKPPPALPPDPASLVQREEEQVVSMEEMCEEEKALESLEEEKESKEVDSVKEESEKEADMQSIKHQEIKLMKFCQ